MLSLTQALAAIYSGRMARPARSPLLGYNHNVKYGGRIYHVQTEDSGPANPHLFTHLYYEGTILATKRHEYDGAVPEDEVRGLMQAQHKAVLKELKQGTYDQKLAGFFETRGESLALDQAAQEATDAAAPALDDPAAPLNLDAFPMRSGETPPPEPAPPPFSHSAGPGVYVKKRPTREQPLVRPRDPPSEPTLPVVVFEPTGPGAATRPSPPAARRPGSGSSHPIVPGSPMAAGPPPMASHVLVQRQVVVGGGATPPTPPPRRRPAPPIPYVVKEGSHPIVPSSPPMGQQPPRSTIRPPSRPPQRAPLAQGSRRPAVPPPPPPRPVVAIAEPLLHEESAPEVVVVRPREDPRHPMTPPPFASAGLRPPAPPPGPPRFPAVTPAGPPPAVVAAPVLAEMTVPNSMPPTFAVDETPVEAMSFDPSAGVPFYPPARETPFPVPEEMPFSPAEPLLPPPVTSATAPMTGALPPSTPPPPLDLDNSLDDVILAYLSRNDDSGSR